MTVRDKMSGSGEDGMEDPGLHDKQRMMSVSVFPLSGQMMRRWEELVLPSGQRGTRSE